MLKSPEHLSQHLCFLPGQALRNEAVAGDGAEHRALNLPCSSSLTCLPCSEGLSLTSVANEGEFCVSE